MEISDKNGLILENVAGPYDEESSIELLCHSKGGKHFIILKILELKLKADTKMAAITFSWSQVL